MTRRDIDGTDPNRTNPAESRRGGAEEESECGPLARRVPDPRRRRRVLARLDALLAARR